MEENCNQVGIFFAFAKLLHFKTIFQFLKLSFIFLVETMEKKKLCLKNSETQSSGFKILFQDIHRFNLSQKLYRVKINFRSATSATSGLMLVGRLDGWCFGRPSFPIWAIFNLFKCYITKCIKVKTISPWHYVRMCSS